MTTSDPKRQPWEMSRWRTFHHEEPPANPPSIGNVLGAVAIAIGAGLLGAYVFDLHQHTCEACGHRWRHLGALNVGDPASHACRQCGTVQWWKDGVPHVFRESLRREPPKPLPDDLVARLQKIGSPSHLSALAAPATGLTRGGLK